MGAYSHALVVLITLCVMTSKGENATVSNLRGSNAAAGANGDVKGILLEIPANDGPIDNPGPYEEEPAAYLASSPLLVTQTMNPSVANDFCGVRETGFWCDGVTRIRCCKLQEGGSYAQCGSTANSSACGWKHDSSAGAENLTNVANASLTSSWWPSEPSWGRRRGGFAGWRIHPGWHVSSFCESHNVGTFCSSHSTIHCCNDYGHFVECNSEYRGSTWC